MRSHLLITAAAAMALAIIPGPAPAADDDDQDIDLDVYARAGRGVLEIRVEARAGRHLADDFAARLALRTIPETELDDVFDLTGRLAELRQGLALDLPRQSPLVVDGELEIGVCDEAGVCRARRVGFQVPVMRRPARDFSRLDLMRVVPVKPSPEPSQLARERMVERFPGLRYHEGDLEAAMADAAARGVPLLAVFKTAWCPPCRQLQAEVLDDRARAAALADYSVVLFDADDPSSWEAKSRWSVGGYPTVILATADGQLVWRQEGYTGARELLDAVATAAAGARPLEELEALATAEPPSDAAILALADRYRALRDRERTAEWFARLSGEADVDGAVRAEVAAFLAGTDPDGEAGAAALEAVLMEQAIAPAVSLRRQMWWWWDLAGMRADLGDDDAARRARERARALAEQRLAAADRDARSELESWSVVAMAAEALSEADAAREAWDHAAAAALRAMGAEGLPDAARIRAAPGLTADLVDALVGAGRADEARQVLDRAVDTLPREPLFFQARARHVAALTGDPTAALADASTAYRLAHGDNRLRAADLWSRLLLDAGQPQEAARVIDEALDGLVLPEDESIRTHRYARVLRERRESIELP